ncbi:MAG TPA: helix-turn-helix transcriptional regulator, partial [Phototrophicaceae bacterium]|nr:helix-turn-helix transcriptional regulator [Phototrophicaceae bacterium]
MSMTYEERLSDSPYVDLVTCGRTMSDGSSVRPAEIAWHMVFVKVGGMMLPIVVGPLTTAGVASWGGDAEILWIKFKPGTFMPHMPTKNLLDKETLMPEANSKAFWLKGSAWQVPSYDNVETFVNRLVHDEILVRDPLVNAALQNHPHDMSLRTVRHRFQQATGLSQNHIQQVERAQRAAALLRQGVSILDTVFETGYFDQPHLTRSLKQWVGHTPAQ